MVYIQCTSQQSEQKYYTFKYQIQFSRTQTLTDLVYSRTQTLTDSVYSRTQTLTDSVYSRTQTLPKPGLILKL